MAAFGLVAAVAFGLWWFGRPEPVRPVEDLMPLVSVMSTGGQGVGGGVGEDSESEMAEATTATSSDAVGVVVVHVAGAVEAPGIYELPAGQRVAEAIAAAGGASDGADLDRLNLAAPIRDGSQVRVPTRDESDATATVTTIGPVGGGADPGDIDAAVDLNRAGRQALESLPGIGPATAAAIVDWRESNGGFRTVDELLAVPGIGPAKFAVLADLVSVG